jgi:hypothetical protein
MAPMMPDGVPIEPALFLETTDNILPVVANPLEEGSGGMPCTKEHKVRVAA